MKKTSLNFLGRKNQSLFDTNVKMKDVDPLDFRIEPAAIPESGTASVRARPTVKHHTSSDTFQGFAVPTPKVPILPPVNGPKINGSVGQTYSNGSVLSVPDLVEGEIFVPPHPSVAPPPPPGTFVLPPPDFMGDLNSPELAHLHLPSVPVMQPPPLSPPAADTKMLIPKRPSVPPPEVPTTVPLSPTATSGRSPWQVPQRPTHAPPKPPVDMPKTQKNPPPKPIRLSSVSNLDLPPDIPAPPPPAHTPTLSTFNPQSPAKLYSSSSSLAFGGLEERDAKPKQIILLDDSGAVNSVPKVAPPSNPAHRDAQQLMENLRNPQPSKSPLSELKKEARTGPVDINKLLPSAPQKSPQTLKVNGTVPTLESTKNNADHSSNQHLKFSPLLDRKLRGLKPETNGPREGAAASPLALLMAAKKREKHRPVGSPSHEDDGSNYDQLSTSSSPDSSAVTPSSSSYSPPPSNGEGPRESPVSALLGHTQKTQTPGIYGSSASVKSQMPPAAPSLSQMVAGSSPTVRNHLEEKSNAHVAPSKPLRAQHEPKKTDLSLPVLPPPPEFGDFVDFMEPPPSMLPPDPPVKKQPTPTVSYIPPAPAPPPPPPKVVPPPPPKLQPADLNVKLKPSSQVAPAQLPPTLSPSQVTLLSILQKKMLEMDQRMSPVEAEPGSDDWGSPLSDEEIHSPVTLKAKPPSKSQPVVNKTTTLDMQELQNKMARKPQESSTVKLPNTSNKTQQQSKHQYGMTFTVRPGTRNPITVVRRGEL